MEFFIKFINVFMLYVQELWWTLALGFLFSGLCFKFVSTDVVHRYLGKKGVRSILLASLTGMVLPVCCIGSLPIAITLKEKGANLGSILAFLVATPATSATAIFLCFKLLGLFFTIFIFISVLLIAIILGLLCSRVNISNDQKEIKKNSSKHKCCSSKKLDKVCGNEKEGLWEDLKYVCQYAFVTLPTKMGKEILIGILLASFITVYEPIQVLIQNYLVGFFGYVIILVFGILTYVCSTASVPLAEAFMESGLSSGQALCYLIAGPVTSYSTILVIQKNFGKKILSIYLSVICVGSLLAGYIFNMISG